MTKSEYDVDGRLVKTIDPLGHETRSSYDAAGQLVSETDSNGHITAHAYDAAGQKISLTPLPTARSLTLPTTRPATSFPAPMRAVTSPPTPTTQNDRKVGMTNPLGAHWAYSYDPAGNPISRTIRSATRRQSSTTRWTGRSGDRRAGARDEDQHMTLWAWSRNRSCRYQTSYGYDADGHLVKTTDPLGHQIGSSYDAAGRSSETDANGHTTATPTTPRARISVIAPDGAMTRFDYDGDGNLISRDRRERARDDLRLRRGRKQDRKDQRTRRELELRLRSRRKPAETVTPWGGTISPSYDAETD